MNKINIILLMAIINVGLLIWGYMDFYNENELINNCNNHWEEQFRTYCSADLSVGGIPLYNSSVKLDLGLINNEIEDKNKNS